jgi:hypothetical protein
MEEETLEHVLDYAPHPGNSSFLPEEVDYDATAAERSSCLSYATH